MDQADTLRKLMRDRVDKPTYAGLTGRVITVASGKGGVGKSCLVANLGTSLARMGQRVLVIDADFGLANLEILFGVQAEASFEQVMSGEATLQDAVIGVEPNLWLLPSRSGLMDARKWAGPERERLVEILEQCPWEMDVIILDAGAGISDTVLSLHSAENESIVILTPEPTSMADGYGLIKTLRKEVSLKRVSIVVNQVTDGREGQQTFQKLKEIAARFLDIQLDYLGHLPRDEKIIQSVMKRRILLDLDGGAPASKCIGLIAKRLLAERLNHEEVMGLSRIQEESAQLAPGQSAKLWRALLGEVNV